MLNLCNSVILVCQVLECFELYQDSNIFHQLIPLFPKVFVILEPISNNSSLIIYADFQFFTTSYMVLQVEQIYHQLLRCDLFSLVLLASSEDWFSHYFSYTYVQSHSLNEQQA